jgi:hypothetical protein
MEAGTEVRMARKTKIGKGAPKEISRVVRLCQFSLIRCFSIALQAASASSKVLKGEPMILIARTMALALIRKAQFPGNGLSARVQQRFTGAT